MAIQARFRALLLAVGMAAYGLFVAACASVPSGWQYEVVMYRALNLESELPCYGDGALHSCGQYLYHGTPEEQRSTSFDIGFSAAESSWYDCASDEIDCVSNSEYVLAVPRGPLKPGLVYRTRGAELVIEKCFEPPMGFPEPGACEVALISSRCVENCRCLEDGSPDRGAVFYYSPTKGITAFAVLSDRRDMRTAMPAFFWTLVADEGFLKKKLALESADQWPPCDDWY